jgi:hypothetical protein
MPSSGYYSCQAWKAIDGMMCCWSIDTSGASFETYLNEDDFDLLTEQARWFLAI